MSDLPPPLPGSKPPPLWRQTIEPHQIDEDEQGETQIGGWLVLLLIGLVLSMFIRAFVLVHGIGIFTKPGIWTKLTSPASPTYHPLWPIVIVYEVGGQSVLLIATCFLLWLMLTHRRAFRPWMIAFLVCIVAFPIGDHLLGAFVPAIHVRQNAAMLTKVFQPLLYVVIWLPYMLVSTRVKATFVR